MGGRSIVRKTCMMLILALMGQAAFAQTVGQWGRHVITRSNTTYAGNPFELEIDASFTHVPSGTTLTIPGYYAGNDQWKVAFMPTLIGAWNYTTFSSDPDLDGVTGSVNVTPSSHPGFFGADPQNPRKWKLSNAGYVIPMALRMEFFFNNGSASDWQQAVEFLADDVDGLMYDTRLQDESTSQMLVFDGNWQNHEFDLSLWDRMEERMNVLSSFGRGAYIMFYADDTGTPAWGGQSATEALLIRYAIARLGSYPIVMWDVGIDIDEYRNNNDIDWFGDQLAALDAYDHPRSSRRGGGSGSIVMDAQNYEGRGDRTAIISDMIGYFQSANLPTVMSDSWGENRPSHPSKNFEPADLRRAFWKTLVAGGLGGFIRGSNGAFQFNTVQSDLESEDWLRLVNLFLRDKLGPVFGDMVPDSSLVSNGYALADPAHARIVYFLMGDDDRYDNGNGGDITARLDSVSGNFTASWFDTRTGQETPAGTLAGGSNHVLTPPSSDDWVLLLVGDGAADITPPAAPTNVTIQ